MNKRHAKPTTAQLVSRVYRKQLDMEKQFVDQLALLRLDFERLASGQRMLSERLESIHEGNLATVKTLADHCARLLREKETLMKAAQALHDSHAYMSEPLKKWEAPRDFDMATMTVKVREYPFDRGCGFKLLHRPGVRCEVCGELTLEESCL
jgi:hypothetical protein